MPSKVAEALKPNTAGNYPKPSANQLILEGYDSIELTLDDHIPARNLIDGLAPSKCFIFAAIFLAVLYFICNDEHDRGTPLVLMAFPSMAMFLMNCYSSAKKFVARSELNNLMTPYYRTLSASKRLNEMSDTLNARAIANTAPNAEAKPRVF